MEQQRDELQIMVEIQRLLGELDPDAARRVARWVADRYRVGFAAATPGGARVPDSADGASNGSGDLAAAYEAANPTKTSERVMVVTYWFQVVQGQTDVDSQKVNTELKQLGHGMKNITSAFSELIRERPQLVLQVRKAGSTRQARKRYRLTAEGIKKVKALMSGASNE
jgi:hypothetical protein